MILNRNSDEIAEIRSELLYNILFGLQRFTDFTVILYLLPFLDGMSRDQLYDTYTSMHWIV